MARSVGKRVGTETESLIHRDAQETPRDVLEELYAKQPEGAKETYSQ